MSAAIRIDPETGRKIFRTRAAKATDKITGKGYSIITDQTLVTLPPPPPGARFNAEEQKRYREFKEARAGAADYMRMEGEFSRYLEDVYSEPPVARGPLIDDCDPGHWCRIRCPASLVPPLAGGLHGRALLREGRRCRWHVVLEPLSGHSLRRREL